jgi:hypothetical protein
MKLISGLFLVTVLSAFTSAKATVNGNAGGLVASGFWDESREGVGLVLRAHDECRGSSKRPE